ncbi:MAG: hypothetical protein RL398_2597 [Planctomycetota bacterium]|jgi:ATP-dependent RNA helicase RhlE
MTAIEFTGLGLSEALLRALRERNYTTPTPIQARAIPHLLQGRDLLGIAQTGTGKTAAFSLPMLDLLTKSARRPQAKRPRALVLAPTRELATQIADSCKAYGKHLKLRTTIVFGGVGQTPQVQALRAGVDILVATPGRLLDLINQQHCELGDVEILVLDEADRMLDMGFLPDVKRILARVPEKRHSLLFSATMPDDITALAKKFLRDPLRVEVTPPAATADRIEQSVIFVQKSKKRDALAQLLEDPAFVRTLVFTRTKHGADRVARHLDKAGIEAHAIHGDKSQGARERALESFRAGKCHVLVATDIAARGIDVKDITHVVNFDLPNVSESYVHRIGRTARAGRDGIAISFCDETEHEYLRDIEKLIKKKIPVVGGSKRSEADVSREAKPEPRRGQQSGQQPGQQRPQRGPAPVPQREAAAAAVGVAEASGWGDGIEDGEAPNDGTNPWRSGDPAAQSQRQAPQRQQQPDRRPQGQARHDGQRPSQPQQRPTHPHGRGQQGQAGRGSQGGHGGHGGRGPVKRRGRPAMPNAVDPEQRREWQQGQGQGQRRGKPGRRRR